MILNLLPIGVTIFVAIVASYWDLFRGRIIPDWLTKPATAFGLSYHVLLGLMEGEPSVCLAAFLSTGIAFGLGYSLYLSGGWAGGDVKLLTAFGALLPRYSPMLGRSLFENLPLFSLVVLFNSALLTLPFLVVYSVIMKRLGKSVFYEEKRITDLKEGDIPAELIYLEGNNVVREKARLLLPRKGKILANPRRASGLETEQIKELIKLVEEGKLENRIRIKRGIPFGPFLSAGAVLGLLCDPYSGLLLNL